MKSIKDAAQQRGDNVEWDDIEDDNGFEPIPEGEYALEVQDTELKENSSETGYLLKVQFQITGPGYGGRTVFSQYNVVHDNPTAQEIGRRELKKLAKSVGVGPKVLDDHTLLRGNALHAWIKIDTWEGNDGEERKDNKVSNPRAPKGDPDGPKNDEGGSSGDWNGNGASGGSGSTDWGDEPF